MQLFFEPFKRLKLWLGICLLIVSMACGKDYVTGKSSYNWFSLKTDIQLGEQVYEVQVEEFQKKKIPVDSAKNQAMLMRIRETVTRLSKASHIPDLPYEAHLADSPIVNAWAAPGGKIMVFEGLWDPEKGLVQRDNPDELAAVLGHEIAHCTARHATKALTKQATLGLIGTAVGAVIAGAGSAQGADLFSQVFSGGMNIYIPSYSRKSESEADKLGLFYMAKAGYDPRAAVEVWKRAYQKKGDKTSIFASHPASGERAKKLEEYLPAAMAIYESNR